MRRLVRFSPEETVPPPGDVLEALPGGATQPGRVREALADALDLFRDLVQPAGVLEEIGQEEFARVLCDSANQAPDTPVALVAAKASGLALFAVTLGEPVSARISVLFGDGDPVLGYLLDAIASCAADRLPGLLAQRWVATLVGRGLPEGEARVLPYSPGYCGWPLTGQRQLFVRLRPEEAGIRLGESGLMSPLKSVSGVLLAGTLPAHAFRPDFPFCEACASRECRSRLAFVARAARDARRPASSPGGAAGEEGAWTS